uniref:Coiled-coil domain-containing protein R3HCC1L isoform X1 n=1 Tax=Rhizophora mucronata TaxID=61149 RepID=A0A2P2L153_RHIMU
MLVAEIPINVSWRVYINLTLSSAIHILKCCCFIEITLSFRPGTSPSKATNISKNCTEADCSGNGVEVACHNLWL